MTDRVRKYITEKQWVIYATLAAFQLMFMFWQCGKQSMWLDEMSFLGTITKDKSVSDILNQYLMKDITNLPLFPLMAALWYRILPANDRLMLLLPELLTALSLVVTAMLAESSFGKKEGIISAILMLISLRAVLNCGFELRSYACMLFFSSLMLLFYYRRGTERNEGSGENRKNEILFFMSMLLLLFTHYSGTILTGILGFFDLIKVIKGKHGVKRLFPYFLSVFLFLPWFILMLIKREKSITSFWKSPPAIPDIARTYKYLLSGNEAVFIVYLLTAILTVCILIRCVLFKREAERRDIISFEMLLSAFLMIGAVFVYSAVINPGGGFFVKRYFIVLLPEVIAVSSYGMVRTGDFFTSVKTPEEKNLFFAVAALFILIYFGFINLSEIRETSGTSWETFREAASYVREQGILEDEGNAALVCSVNERATAGFAEYYVRHGGKYKEIPAISLQGNDPVTEMKKYDRLYLVYVHRDLSDLDPLITETLEKEYRLKEENEPVRAAVYERKK